MIKLRAKYLGDKEHFFKFTVQDDWDGKEYFLQLIHDGLVFRCPENQDEKCFYGAIGKKETADIIFKSGFTLGLVFQVMVDSDNSDKLSIFIKNLGISNISIKNLKRGVSVFKF